MKRSKKLIVPTTENKRFEEVNPRNVEVVPPVESLLQDAYAIMNTELQYMKKRASDGHRLSPAESRILVSYVKGLVEASKEERARDKDAGGEAMSDEELLEAARAAVAELEEKTGKGK